MARVTVEDCILQIPNRFELVLLASQRARKIGNSVALTVSRDNDKNPVVALREIAEGTVGVEYLHNGLVQSLQKHISSDESEKGMHALLSEIDFSDDTVMDDEIDEETEVVEEGELSLQELCEDTMMLKSGGEVLLAIEELKFVEELKPVES